MFEKRILIVDDETQICSMYSQRFSRAGYDVTTANSAEDALEIIQNTPFQVFFLDLDLPGMNGIELCRHIRNQYPMAIPIAVAGYASISELTDCRNAGFEDYFIKPVSLTDLMDAAEHAFAKLARWEKNNSLPNK